MSFQYFPTSIANHEGCIFFIVEKKSGFLSLPGKIVSVKNSFFKNPYWRLEAACLNKCPRVPGHDCGHNTNKCKYEKDFN